jgi:hypothetical protein
MNYDAILILGGGVRTGGELPEYAKRRFDLALARQSGEPLLPLSARTFHSPAILESDGRVVNEAIAGARYLIDRGIDPARIFCENTALDTLGTAYFGRVQLTDPMGWRHLLVITSQFHMPRSEAIFRWIYSLDAPVPYQLEFAASSDDGLSEASLAARVAREQASLRSLGHLRERLTSLRTLAEWLFTEHKAYMAVREPLAPQSGDLLDSY